MAKIATHDSSLAENPGMKKTINTYTATGNVEDLAMGVGNSDSIEVAFTAKDYEIEVTQGRFPYFDEEEMKDPMVVETGLKKLAAQMTNDLTKKIVAEFGKATIVKTDNLLDFDAVVDALALYPYEREDNLFMLINPSELA